MSDINCKACPVCDAKDISLFMKGIFDSEDTEVHECEACGTQFLSPMMSQQEEDAYYDDYYNKQASRHFTQMSLTDVQNRAFSHYENYAETYLSLVKNAKSFLEIGSGSGGFIKFLKKYRPDIEIHAIERCGSNVDFIRDSYGNTIKLIKDMDEANEKKWDVIGAFGVFEHVRDSLGFLNSLRSRLAPGGKIALNVPNKYHSLVYAFDCEEFKKFTYMKQHYYTFTEKSFEILAQKSGLEVEKFNYLQVWSLDNQLSWLRYRQPRKHDDITDMLSPETLRLFNQDMIRHKTTDLMMAVLSN